MARTQYVATRFQLGTTERPGRVLYAPRGARITPAMARKAATARGGIRLAGGGRAYYQAESNRSEEE